MKSKPQLDELSPEQVESEMDNYLDISANRLRTRLKTAWKKQSTAERSKIYDQTKL